MSQAHFGDEFPEPLAVRRGVRLTEVRVLHTKLGAGARRYFRAVRTAADTVVLVGYFGDHLPTVRYRT